jgi:hypothetical protein
MLAAPDVTFMTEDGPELDLQKLELVVAHLAAVAAVNERLGRQAAVLRAKAEQALALLSRVGLADLPAGPALSSAQDDRRTAQMVRVYADRWRVVHEGEVATVPDRIGMRYLAELVAAPDQAVPALALVTRGGAPPEAHRTDAVMDRRAVAELRNRIRAIREQADLAPADEEELARLTQTLARVTGLGGRLRSFANAPERARTAVRKAIKRAIEAIALANPAVGRHLTAHIETGAACCYRP